MFTLIVVVIVFELGQPPALTPITEYVVVLVGFTVKLVPVAPEFIKV